MLLIHYSLSIVMMLGVMLAVAGLAAVRAFAARPPAELVGHVPVSILKPVCGNETLLEQAIASFCTQDYPDYQLVIGAQDPDDPALAVARRVQARFPSRRIDIVVDATRHGPNGKIANLINMLPAARHDTLVIADSDMHVRPDYVRRVVAALQRPGTGLVTTPSCGEAIHQGLAGRLGAMHMSHHFMPSVLMAVALGRQDCLGGTMALHKDTLRRIGGLRALAGHLADDNMLSTLVARLGLATRLAYTIPVMTVQEHTLGALWQHEIRWARTIGALAPISLAFSVVQFPLVWALLDILLSGFAWNALLAFVAIWAIRALTVHGMESAVVDLRGRPSRGISAWLQPLRELLSVIEIAASFRSDIVVWRGRTLHAQAGAGGGAAVPTIQAAAPVAASILVEDETLAA